MNPSGKPGAPFISTIKVDQNGSSGESSGPIKNCNCNLGEGLSAQALIGLNPFTTELLGNQDP
jgi:hypothetical protein